MSQQLTALLHRYYITYFRFKGRVVNDFLLGIIIGGALLVRSFGVLQILAGIIFLLTVPFTFLTSVRTMLGEIVSERSSGIKEYLKLNGLSAWIYQMYLLIVTTVKVAFFTGFVIGGLFIGDLLKTKSDISFVQLGLFETIEVYVLCALATISFILFFSIVFSDAKVASSVGGMLYAAVSLVSMIVFASKRPEFYYLACLFPQSALTLSLYKGNKPNSWPEGINFQRVKLMLVFDFFLYLILFMYLDQVTKDENGVSKSLFFCLKCKKRRVKTRRHSELVALTEGLINSSEEEVEKDTSSAVFHEELHEAHLLKKTVQINNLKKKFGDFTAVDNISFSIYSKQIFCLLGHNGAGKTTTIKMLTGLLEIDQGEIFYDEENFLDNFEEARTKIGICTQNDILFEKLTVAEHLALIAKLRKINVYEIEEAIEEALKKVNLVNERDKFSEELSGGNKRKLSLAMAVLGGTKVIFLDEPTSGMDPQNRRVMWYHLKQLKEQGLTILLTTHHLDEADELADRVAIMSKGKLLALGTSEFFKKNFGVGYHLNLTPVYNKITPEQFLTIKNELYNIIMQTVPSAVVDHQTAADVVKCSLPFTAQKEFPKLFSELEKVEGIRISVEMNTLEDVFVNIGLSEDRLLHGESANTEINLNIMPPACLGDKPKYNFLTQTFALAKRRVYLLLRSKRNLFLMILPLVLTLLGVIGAFGFSFKPMRFGFFQIVIFIAYTLNTGIYCSLPVYEREEKLKYLMDVMGLRNLPYWIGNFVVDAFFITIMNVMIYGLYIMFYNEIAGFIPFIPTPTNFLCIAIPHGFALITMGYAFSFLFEKSLTAIKIFPLLYFFLLSNVSVGLVIWIGLVEHPYLSALPGILCPSTHLLLFFAGQIANEGSQFTLTHCIIAELTFCAIYFLITIALESRRLSANDNKNTRGYVIPEPQTIPIDINDIEFERNRSLNSPQEPIKAASLTKIYDNGYTAVRGISFGVEPGQIFGLLGPNGAGKSTTFNMLTAAISKSQGSVQLLNKEVNRNMPEVYEHVGICPQFNGLWEFLTVKEHLTLFGNLKGVTGNNLDQVINYYLDVLQLREYANKKAGDLSGGNKRKLCVANAFIGSAHLIFLDEPSTGVDPLARRFLWNSIQQVLTMRTASVVLTTHSMYEAESLSHKIGILINGRFVCIGPTQYLKDKYSQGYKITISLNAGAPDPSQAIVSIFPLAVRLNEASTIQQTYHIPFEGFKFSGAFKKLEELKEKGEIKDFSIYNTTLEQIFIYFSRFQIVIENN